MRNSQPSISGDESPAAPWPTPHKCLGEPRGAETFVCLQVTATISSRGCLNRRTPRTRVGNAGPGLWCPAKARGQASTAVSLPAREPFACCTSLAGAQPATFRVLFSNTLDYCCKCQFKACLSSPWLVVQSVHFPDSREWELNPLWLSLWPICPADYGCSNTWVAGTAEQHLSVKSVIFQETL